MTNPLTKRYSPIAAAAAAQIMVVELDAAVREAALKLPIKEAIRECGPAVAEQVSAELLRAVNRFRGKPIASMDELEAFTNRLTLHPDDDELEPGERGEAYVIDGEQPLLWVGPIKIERMGQPGDESLRASRPVYHFLPPLVGEEPEDGGPDVGPNGRGV